MHGAKKRARRLDQQDRLGTVHLEALQYQNVDLKKFYPYGEPVFAK